MQIMAMSRRFPLNVWAWLTAPNPTITDIEERRRSQLLAVVMLSLQALIGLTGLRQINLNLTYGDTDRYTVAVIAVEMVLSVPIFYLNRRGKYRISALTFLALGYGLIVVYTLFDSNGSFLFPIVILMSAIFLSYTDAVKGVAIVIGTQFLLLFVKPRFIALTFTAYMAALTLTFVRFRFQVEQERQKELREANEKLRASESALQHSNATLEDKVKARTAELETAKDVAERANHVKSAFLASMSHELRTPLNAVINFTKFVANGDLGEVNSDQVETLNEVVGSGKHLLNLINDVLDMSKIEAGSLNLFVEDDVSLKSILASVDPIARTLLADKPVTLTIEMTETLPLLRVDRQRILQVVLNIVSNACKFTKEGSIHLQAVQQGDNVLISVKDTGPGIAPEDHALVFEAFKQTDAGLRQGGGTGLGMPISKSLVESHGGRFWLESESGKGATFFVLLPIKSTELVPMFGTKEHVN